MADGHEKWNNDEIASHLKSAVETLTPNVLDKIDLSSPQLLYTEPPRHLKVYQGMRRLVTAAAACLCIAALYGGGMRWQNTRVESVIGLDVNPSIEISVNRKDKILEAEPLNDDGAVVLADMELNGVDLNIGVNAIIGSMVRCGYLDELDNAILVTVANDDREKASVLRQDVVTDIESSLEAHKVNAVVYDQQATDMKEITEIAEQYGISYGKACFLYELVEENGLTEKELEAFASMTMEEIAKEIADRSYQVGADTGREEPSAGTTVVTRPETSETPSEPLEPSSESQIPSETEETKQPNSSADTQTPSQTEESSEDEKEGKKARIDYADYYEGILEITFKEKVKWKNPTVSVTDADGASYAARITDTGSNSCQIEINGITGGESYTFVLNGVKPRENGSYSSVKGYFDAPDISGDAGENDSDETEGEEADKPEAGESVPESEPSSSEETQTAPETGESSQQTEAPKEADTLPAQTKPSEAGAGA